MNNEQESLRKETLVAWTGTHTEFSWCDLAVSWKNSVPQYDTEGLLYLLTTLNLGLIYVLFIDVKVCLPTSASSLDVQVTVHRDKFL